MTSPDITITQTKQSKGSKSGLSYTHNNTVEMLNRIYNHKQEVKRLYDAERVALHNRDEDDRIYLTKLYGYYHRLRETYRKLELANPIIVERINNKPITEYTDGNGY